MTAFRTGIQRFAHTIYTAWTGTWPNRFNFHAAVTREAAQEKAKGTFGSKVSAVHVIHVNGQWWQVLATPMTVHIPLPPIEFRNDKRVLSTADALAVLKTNLEEHMYVDEHQWTQVLAARQQVEALTEFFKSA